MSSLSSAELLWDERQRLQRAQTSIDRRESLQSFAQVFILIVLTLGIATMLAGSSSDRAASYDRGRSLPSRAVSPQLLPERPGAESVQQKSNVAQAMQ